MLLMLDAARFASYPQLLLLAAVRRMASARVTMLGLGALSDDAAPVYDRRMAERLAGCGMEIAALTPDRFAEWIGARIA